MIKEGDKGSKQGEAQSLQPSVRKAISEKT